LPNLDNEFLEVARTKQDAKKILPVWPIAKFVSFLFWMLTSSPTWENWEQKSLHVLFLQIMCICYVISGSMPKVFLF
jgi:hypothetical protein